MATRAEQKGLELFHPQFGKATADDAGFHRSFLFYAHAVEPRLLEIVVSDFGAYTFRCRLSEEELDDMRDNIGVGGPWSEFVDYIVKSLESDDVKMLLDHSLASSAGAMTAKLIACKAKGMPRVTFILDRLLNSSASDSNANFSMALYRSFKKITKDLVEEQNQNMQLSKQLSSVKEKNEDLQKQLDAYRFKNKQTQSKSRMPEKMLFVSEDARNFEGELDFKSDQPSDVKSSKDSPSTKRSKHIFHARRPKTRGAVLQNDEDNIDFWLGELCSLSQALEYIIHLVAIRGLSELLFLDKKGYAAHLFI